MKKNKLSVLSVLSVLVVLLLVGFSLSFFLNVMFLLGEESNTTLLTPIRTKITSFNNKIFLSSERQEGERLLVEKIRNARPKGCADPLRR